MALPLSTTAFLPLSKKLTFSSNKTSHPFATPKPSNLAVRTTTVAAKPLHSNERVNKLDENQFKFNQRQEDNNVALDGERRLSKVWREIHGQEAWAGLLDPMDPLLRSELIRYGEMTQACYDAFDYDPFSKYCGSCRFTKQSFFESLDMAHHGYRVTRYLYASSSINLRSFFKNSRSPKAWSQNANWIGYVAVSDDEATARLGRRDISIAWRGTVTRIELIADFLDYLKPIPGSKIMRCPDPRVKVEYGFLDLYTYRDETCPLCMYSAREQILTEVKRLVEKYSGEELSVTISGHSLGASLAILSAYDITEMGLNVTMDGRVVPVSVFSFSGPRVGNVRFKVRLESLGVKVLRVVNVHDIVPKTPGWFYNERMHPMLMKVAEGLPWSYTHVGVQLKLDHTNSPFLKRTTNLASPHNLEAHLHLLDGYHGKGDKFELASARDPALVNKASDFLKDQYLVPPHWRQEENKGMVRSKDGRWIRPERPNPDDEHPEDMHYHLKQLGLAAEH